MGILYLAFFWAQWRRGRLSPSDQPASNPPMTGAEAAELYPNAEERPREVGRRKARRGHPATALVGFGPQIEPAQTGSMPREPPPAALPPAVLPQVTAISLFSAPFILIQAAKTECLACKDAATTSQCRNATIVTGIA